MTFLEKELHKIIDPLKRDALYVGGSAYIRLGDVKIRAEIIEGGVSRHYDALRLTAMNRTEGKVDVNVIRFLDLWGRLPTTNPNFQGGVAPHIWEDHLPTSVRVAWYVAAPSAAQYKLLTKEVEKYIAVFA